MKKQYFYISGVLCIQKPLWIDYYLFTNAGCCLVHGYDRLPDMAKEYLQKHISDSTSPSIGVAILADGAKECESDG